MKPRVVLMGGFGNQLFQLAFALDRYKDSPFTLETLLGSPRMDRNSVAEIFTFKLPENIEPSFKRSNRVVVKFLHLALLANLNSTRNCLSKVSAKLSQKMAEISVALFYRRKYRIIMCDDVGYGELTHKDAKVNDLIVGYFQSEKWVSDSVRNELQKIEPKCDTSEIQHLKEMASIQKPIIVHVRLGDYEMEDGIGLLPFSYYHEGLTLLQSKLPNREIWLFSNDLEKAKHKFLQWQGRPINFIDDTWDSTAITFEAMRLGAGYLIGNSTFSYWAAMLSRELNPIVVAPKPWFLNAKSPSELIPMGWIQIDSV